MVRAGLDATPLLGPRTGVGQYVARLVPALLALPEPPELLLAPFTVRGARDVPAFAGVLAGRRRVPARVAHRLWERSELLPVEWVTGRVDLFHGTNFVLPPTRHAAGVVMIHDLGYELFPELVSAASRRYRALVPRALARRSTVVVTPSAATANDVVGHYGFDPARVVVTPLGVDRTWGTTTPAGREELNRLGLPADFLLFVGNREPRKNLQFLLRGYALLRSGHPDVPRLVLVGPPGWGPLLDASALPAGSVVPVDYLPEEMLRRVVAAARVLVLPSRYEGFGLPLLEALACGTPVVASDLPVVREVSGGHAALVPLDDAAGLAAALAAVLDDDGGAPARAVRRAYAAGWTWQRCARATVAAYRLALDLRAGDRTGAG